MSSKKIHIALILPSLIAGGAERVLSTIARNLDPEQFNVTLVNIGIEKDNAYNVDGIKVIYLNKKRVLNGFPGLFKYIFKYRPAIVFSSMSHLNTAMALILLFFPSIKLVTRESNIKKITKQFHKTRQSFLGESLRKISYWRTDAIICQSIDMADEFVSYYPKSKPKINVINNLISDEFTVKSGNNHSQILKFITIGRLHLEKGHMRILNGLSNLKIPFQYTIVGDGEAREIIKDHVDQLKLQSSVRFIQYARDVSKHLKDSDFFLQGSFAEGFPNALLESCAVGTPAIAFKSLGGTREIIVHGVNGYLVNNEEELVKVLNDQSIYNTFNATEVSNSVYEKFGKAIIIKKVEDLFIKLIKKP